MLDFLKKGFEYEVVSSVFNFKVGEIYTFIGVKTLYLERDIDGYEYLFHHLESDKLFSYRLSDKEFFEVEKYFHKLNGWEIPTSNKVTSLAYSEVELLQGKKLLDSHIPYFKSIIEGVKGIKNWYDWFGEYDLLLQKILSRTEYLCWKTNPIEEIEKFLIDSNITFKRNARYLWLANDISKYFNY